MHRHKNFPFGKKMLRDKECVTCREIAQKAMAHRKTIERELNKPQETPGQEPLFTGE